MSPSLSWKTAWYFLRSAVYRFWSSLSVSSPSGCSNTLRGADMSSSPYSSSSGGSLTSSWSPGIVEASVTPFSHVCCLIPRPPRSRSRRTEAICMKACTLSSLLGCPATALPSTSLTNTTQGASTVPVSSRRYLANSVRRSCTPTISALGRSPCCRVAGNAGMACNGPLSMTNTHVSHPGSGMSLLGAPSGPGWVYSGSLPLMICARRMRAAIGHHFSPGHRGSRTTALSSGFLYFCS